MCGNSLTGVRLQTIIFGQLFAPQNLILTFILITFSHMGVNAINT